MTTAHHTLVWIDHQEAKIFNFTETEDEHLVVRSAHPHQHLHHKAHAQGSGHVPVETPFLKRVAEAIAATTSLVICGPSNARHELASFIRKTDPRLAIAIRAVEPLDHPSDGELLKLGRQFFRPAERLQAMLRG